jgi:hypothetical protein
MTDPIDRLRRPAYTGDRRCWPCTVLNLAIVVASAALVSLWNRPAGLLVVAVGVGLVAVRGYVVPGTPRVAPRLVAPLPVSVGHGGDADRPPDALADAGDPERVLAALVDAGVVSVGNGGETGGDDLFLDPAFRDAWTDRMAALRAADESAFLDRVAAACPTAVDARLDGDRVLLAGERDVRTSRAVAIAETAAVETLREWGVPDGMGPPAATPLRTFLRTCPACCGPVRETTVRNCCGGPGSVYGHPEQPVLACDDCETVVVELDTAEA